GRLVKTDTVAILRTHTKFDFEGCIARSPLNPPGAVSELATTGKPAQADLNPSFIATKVQRIMSISTRSRPGEDFEEVQILAGALKWNGVIRLQTIGTLAIGV